MWFKELFEGRLGEYFLSLSDKKEETTKEQLLFLKEALKQGSVLDHCCGAGRLSIPLSLERKDIIGLDLSKYLLTQAKNRAKKTNTKNLSLIRADMRHLPFKPNTFNNIINLWTSFGYFPDKENENVLKEIAKVIKPKGIFIIDITNPDWILQNFKEKDWHEQENFYLLQQRSLNWQTKRINVRWIFINKHNKETNEINFDHRLYSIEELKNLLQKQGLKTIHEYGSFRKKLDRASSNRIIIVSKKS